MVANETPALRAVTLEILATGADWSISSKNLATGCEKLETSGWMPY